MAKECPKCRSSMTEGLIIDKDHSGTRHVSSWLEGVPVRSFWGGIKLQGKKPIEIQTFRCNRCGRQPVVARDHDGLDAHLPQLCKALADAVLDDVSQLDDA